MNPQVIEYIKTQRVCVLAVEMPDGSPHAAAVHFAHTADPLTFIILTSPESRKYQAFAKVPARATMVIGTTEEGQKTLQLDGEIRLSDNQEFQHLYDEKFPSAQHLFKKDQLFTFTPTWWRFTDWSSGKRIILLSE